MTTTPLPDHVGQAAAFVIYDHDGETFRSDYSEHVWLAEQVAEQLHTQRRNVRWLHTPGAGLYSLGEIDRPQAGTLVVAEFHGYPTDEEVRRLDVVIASSAVCPTAQAAREYLAGIAELLDIDGPDHVLNGVKIAR